MHEMSLVESLVDLCEDERRRQPFAKIRMIRLEVGALGGAEPDALRFCFDAVARGTIAEGAHLVIETIAGQGWCAGCCRSVAIAERFAACPVCDGIVTRIIAGDALRLAELEVE